jgi:hypothetical protein
MNLGSASSEKEVKENGSQEEGREEARSQEGHQEEEVTSSVLCS